MSTMMPERNYLQSAVQSASPVALTILLYDRLMADIRQASAAMKSCDIEKRCELLNHAFLVIAHLEAGLDLERGGDTAASLAKFYACLRSKLIEAQVKLSPQLLEEQIELILTVRQAWQKVESTPAAQDLSRPRSDDRMGQNSARMLFQTPPDEGGHASSWTA